MIDLILLTCYTGIKKGLAPMISIWVVTNGLMISGDIVSDEVQIQTIKDQDEPESVGDSIARDLDVQDILKKLDIPPVNETALFIELSNAVVSSASGVLVSGGDCRVNPDCIDAWGFGALPQRAA